MVVIIEARHLLDISYIDIFYFFFTHTSSCRIFLFSQTRYDICDRYSMPYYWFILFVNVIQFYQSTTDASSSLLCRRDSEVAILPTQCHFSKASSSSSSSSSSLSCHFLSHLSSSSPVHGRYSVSLLWWKYSMEHLTNWRCWHCP